MALLGGNITAEKILLPLKGDWESGNPHTIITGLSTDSRQIGIGEIFFALRGENFNGHDFISKALERGASGAVVQKGMYSKSSPPRDSFVISVENSLRALGDLAGWWRRQHNLKVLAITGTTGKTTTKEMIAGILTQGRKILKSEGNFNNLIGLPLSLLRIDQKHEIAVLEMGMNRKGEIARLTEIADPDLGLITNVGLAHLEELDNLEGVANAKTEMVERISSRGTVIINGDNSLLRKKVSILNKNMITFGMRRGNDIRADAINNLGTKGLSFKLNHGDFSWPVTLHVPGVQNVYNALAASAACLCINEPPENIITGLGIYRGLKGRFSVNLMHKNAILVDDTYNSNPSSLKAALMSVSEMAKGDSKIIVGIGEMLELGNAAASEHRKAGQKVAEAGVHHLLVMGDHSDEVIQGAVAAGMSRKEAEVVNTHDEMIDKIKGEVGEGDIVLLKASRKMTFEKVVEGLLIQ